MYIHLDAGEEEGGRDPLRVFREFDVPSCVVPAGQARAEFSKEVARPIEYLRRYLGKRSGQCTRGVGSVRLKE